MVSLGIIADDLTGANDTGVQFAKQGLQTTVLFSEAQVETSIVSGDVIVVNSDSRAVETEESYKIVHNIASKLHKAQVTRVFKKIDSTMRGNIGAEIDAVMDVYPFQISIVVPSFPKSNRVTENGIHYVSGIPLTDTEFANDPTCPVDDSNLVALLEKQSNRSVKLISLEDVRKGPTYLIERLRDISIHSPKSIVVMDAVSEEDLNSISLAGWELKENALWVGSAGIASHISTLICKRDHVESKTIQARHPILVVGGSMSPVTHQQTRVLKEHNNINEIVIQPCEFLQSSSFSEEVERVLEKGQELLKNGDLIISTNRDKEHFLTVKEVQGEFGLTNYEVGKRISAGIGEITSRLVRSRTIQGIILTGGDIAGVTCNQLDGNGIRVFGEVEDGIPYGELFGGPFEGLPIVTKAGAFGSEQAFLHALQALLGVRATI
ncbi:four-carbon acid sugar kinase family protein [Halobacillus mangrovi]|uniref:four-carbon acid sugar kinase family protein n=1 Tax=Halobacillus mangrovi TaxID=402384 RepID=UPI001E3C0AB7|nr:four-carbon acid sugar kinase family protein [Halobacillus mangrovi]